MTFAKRHEQTHDLAVRIVRELLGKRAHGVELDDAAKVQRLVLAALPEGEETGWRDSQAMARIIRNRVVAIRDAHERKERGLNLSWQLGRLIDDIDVQFNLGASANLADLPSDRTMRDPQ